MSHTKTHDYAPNMPGTCITLMVICGKRAYISA
nr:MAG TPA_asm: hypothetical protein [Caudoviricetes sp.]